MKASLYAIKNKIRINLLTSDNLYSK